MILVVCEHEHGAAAEISQQAVTFSRLFGPDQPVEALMIGPAGEDTASGLGAFGAQRVHVAASDQLGAFAPDAWAAITLELADRLGAGCIIAAGSERGNDVMARVAARRDLPLAANCITATGTGPVDVTRVRWGGSLLEEASLDADTILLTVAAHTTPVETTSDAPAAVEVFSPKLDPADLVVRVRETVTAQTSGVSLADAKVVVTGGRGVGSAEGFVVIEQLAAELGAAVGCSRAVTMAGWRPHTDQVGQTGTKIAPELYIACGVSGATQHIAGCRGAKRILAINNDPEAAILSVADYAVIGDLHEVVPAITAQLQRGRGTAA